MFLYHYLSIYLFLAILSSLLHELFSSCGKWGYSSCGVRGFSLWRFLLLWSTGSRACGPGAGCGSPALAPQAESCGAQA